MKSKIKIILFAFALLVSLLIGKLSLSSDLSFSQYLKYTKSELWAMSHQLRDFKASESIASKKWESDRDPMTSPETMSSDFISKNFTESLPYGFPLGWYDAIKNLSTPAKIANEGINLVIPYTGKGDAQEVRAYLDRAAAAGIKVLVDIPRDSVRKGHTVRITKFVKQLKNHPALFGWYLFDEPGFISLSPNLLQKFYQAIKLEDPKHPIAVAFAKLDNVRNYTRSVDIVMYSNYPCRYNEPEFHNFQNSTFPTLAREAKFLARERKTFWFILQAYGEDKHGRPNKYRRRFPTAAEERYMLYSAVLANTDGLFFWTHYRSRQNWINSVMTPLVRELQGYLPAIKTAALRRKLAIANPKIQASLYRDPTTQNLLLIAVNHNDSQIETTVRIRENTRAQSANVLTENRVVNLADRTFSDTFEPYGVHIYQIN